MTRKGVFWNLKIEKSFWLLDEVEKILGERRFFASDDTLTFADVQLWVTLIRFDEVYVVHFKTNKKQISECPNIMTWMRRLWRSVPVFKETCKMSDNKKHYYGSHDGLNKFGIIPTGPDFIGKLESE